jgi:hypothetical protein
LNDVTRKGQKDDAFTPNTYQTAATPANWRGLERFVKVYVYPPYPESENEEKIHADGREFVKRLVRVGRGALGPAQSFRRYGVLTLQTSQKAAIFLQTPPLRYLPKSAPDLNELEQREAARER